MKKKLFFGMNLVLLLLVAVFFLSQHTAAQMLSLIHISKHQFDY